MCFCQYCSLVLDRLRGRSSPLPTGGGRRGMATPGMRLQVPVYDMTLPQHQGSLLEKLLEGHGIARLKGLQTMHFDPWLQQLKLFVDSPGLLDKNLVKLTVNEERLGRTLIDKSSESGVVGNVERRAIFDVKHNILTHEDALNPHYSFFRAEYEALAKVLFPWLRSELAAGAPDSPSQHSELSQSILRHNFYPADGSCGEHTDYGFITVICCSASGLQVKVQGEWHAVELPAEGQESTYLILAGDMMERITSGAIPAVVHAITLPPDIVESADLTDKTIVRQSGALFLQPALEEEIAPSSHFPSPAEDAGDNYGEPVQFGEWLTRKKRLAFSKS